MTCAKDLMTSNPVTVTPDTPISQAIGIMLDKKINGLPVVRGTKLVGILSQGDLVSLQKRLPLPSVFTLLDAVFPLRSPESMEKAFKKVAAAKVGDAMTEDPVTIGPETPLEEIALLMSDRKFYTLPVVQDGRLVGVVGKEDVLKTLVG
jgi:CBS domain-containing protein